MVFSAASASGNRLHIYFPSDDRISVYSNPTGVSTWYYGTTALARDPSAWMHLVFACDTTQATANDRFKIYVNGVLIDSYSSRVNPPQNHDTVVNSTILHQFSGRAYNTDDHFDGYLADAHFIDGQALAPTDFGEFNSNNVWQPKEHTFGTNPNNGTTWDSAKANSYDGTPITDSVVGTCTFTGLNGNFTSTLSTNVTVNKHLRLQMYANTSTFDTYCDIQLNGSGEQTVTVHESQGGQAGIYDVAFTGTLSSIKVTAKGGANVGLAQVIVDDYILINGADDNSFKLDFNSTTSNQALGYDASVDSPSRNNRGGFDAITYTGNGGNQTIKGLAFQPDFVWIKRRNSTSNHAFMMLYVVPQKFLDQIVLRQK